MRGSSPIGAKISACPGRCAAWSEAEWCAADPGPLHTPPSRRSRTSGAPLRYRSRRTASGTRTPYLSAYGVKPAGDARECVCAESMPTEPLEISRKLRFALVSRRRTHPRRNTKGPRPHCDIKKDRHGSSSNQRHRENFSGEHWFAHPALVGPAFFRVAGGTFGPMRYAPAFETSGAESARKRSTPSLNTLSPTASM